MERRATWEYNLEGGWNCSLSHCSKCLPSWSSFKRHWRIVVVIIFIYLQLMCSLSLAFMGQTKLRETLCPPVRQEVWAAFYSKWSVQRSEAKSFDLPFFVRSHFSLYLTHLQHWARLGTSSTWWGGARGWVLLFSPADPSHPTHTSLTNGIWVLTSANTHLSQSPY